MPVFIKTGFACISPSVERCNAGAGWFAEVLEIEGRQYVLTDKQDSRFCKLVSDKFDMLNFLTQERNAKVDMVIAEAARSEQQKGPMVDDTEGEPVCKKPRKEAVDSIPSATQVTVTVLGSEQTVWVA
eukprot:5777790-Pyramimonas_sp.AAC.1